MKCLQQCEQVIAAALGLHIMGTFLCTYCNILMGYGDVVFPINSNPAQEEI